MDTKHIFLSEETHKTIKILAAKRGVTMKECVDQVLQDYLESIKKGER